MGRMSSIQMTTGYLRQLQGTYNDYTNLFKQADGERLHKASDDSVAYAKYLRYQNYSAGNEQYQKNVSTAVTWMKTTDKSLTNTTDLLQTFMERTVNAGNDSNNDSDMKDIAKELFSMVEEIVVQMNQEVGGRYVLAGQSDNRMPFMISADRMDRGDTKTLNESQKAFFQGEDTGNLCQFLILNGDDGKQYCLNTKTYAVYDKDFVDTGYKKNILAGQTVVDDTTDAICKLDPEECFVGDKLNISDYFKPNGVIKDTGAAWSAKVDFPDGSEMNFSFSTSSQYVASYLGDDKHISMVTQAGAIKPESDTINVTGQQVWGSDIFDCEGHQSGTAMLNGLLRVVAKVDGGDQEFSGDDGISIVDTAIKQVLRAQTTVAARYQSYEGVEAMLITQNESLTVDIDTVGGSDIAWLSTQLMQCQTLYNLSIAMGGKLFPGSLGDYL